MSVMSQSDISYFTGNGGFFSICTCVHTFDLYRDTPHRMSSSLKDKNASGILNASTKISADTKSYNQDLLLRHDKMLNLLLNHNVLNTKIKSNPLVMFGVTNTSKFSQSLISDHLRFPTACSIQ